MLHDSNHTTHTTPSQPHPHADKVSDTFTNQCQPIIDRFKHLFVQYNNTINELQSSVIRKDNIIEDINNSNNILKQCIDNNQVNYNKLSNKLENNNKLIELYSKQIINLTQQYNDIKLQYNNINNKQQQFTIEYNNLSSIRDNERYAYEQEKIIMKTDVCYLDNLYTKQLYTIIYTNIYVLTLTYNVIYTV